MKRHLLITALLGICSGTVFSVSPARANNVAVERALASYGDLSTFYAAALNTGVLAQLDPNQQYTIFAPTNEAFAEMRPEVFPCFYTVQCRGPVADMVRDHIVAGAWTPKELVHQGTLSTLGPYRLFAESPYVGDYTVGNAKVLSDADLHGTMIYRINDVILHHRQMAAFQASPPVKGTVTQEKVITTYRTPADYPIPGGGYAPGMHEVVTEKTYVVPGAMPKGRSSSTTVVYPDGDSSTTVRSSYGNYDSESQ